jgi:hypothetical protein
VNQHEKGLEGHQKPLMLHFAINIHQLRLQDSHESEGLQDTSKRFQAISRICRKLMNQHRKGWQSSAALAGMQ